MFDFVNRSAELAMICDASDPYLVLNIFGESGIGKTRLMDQAFTQLTNARDMKVKVNLEQLTGASLEQKATQVIDLILCALHGEFRPPENDPAAMAEALVATIAGRNPGSRAYLFFDTTEVLQDDIEFWRWLEVHLISRLVFEPGARFVFAGRIPAPFSRIEIRRSLKLLHLEPLATGNESGAAWGIGERAAGRELVTGILKQQAPQWTEDQLTQAVDMVIEFSCGHPMLSEQLAEAIATFPRELAPAELRQQLAQDLIKPFIQDKLFENVEEPWKRILELASVLDWFDPVILMRFIRHADPALVAGRQVDFFLRGVTQLRQRHTVVWQGTYGDTLHGVIAPIVRHYLQVANPTRHQLATLAAAKTFREFAQEELPGASPEHELYLRQADEYQRRAANS